MLQSFDFPAVQGKRLSKKTESTEFTLNKYGVTAANKSYGERIGLKLTKPD